MARRAPAELPSSSPECLDASWRCVSRPPRPDGGKRELKFTFKGLSTNHRGELNLSSLRSSTSMCLDPHTAGVKHATKSFSISAVYSETTLPSLSSPLTSGAPTSVTPDRISACVLKMADIKKKKKRSLYSSTQAPPLPNPRFQKYQRIKWQERGRCDGCDIACLNVRDRVGITTSSPSDKVWVLILNRVSAHVNIKCSLYIEVEKRHGR